MHSSMSDLERGPRKAWHGSRSWGRHPSGRGEQGLSELGGVGVWPVHLAAFPPVNPRLFPGRPRIGDGESTRHGQVFQTHGPAVQQCTPGTQAPQKAEPMQERSLWAPRRVRQGGLEPQAGLGQQHGVGEPSSQLHPRRPPLLLLRESHSHVRTFSTDCVNRGAEPQWACPMSLGCARGWTPRSPNGQGCVLGSSARGAAF